MKTFPRPVWLPQRPRAGAGAPGESAGARRRSGGGPGTRIELQVTYIRLGFAVLALGILSPSDDEAEKGPRETRYMYRRGAAVSAALAAPQ